MNRVKVYHKDIMKQDLNTELFLFLANRSLSVEQITKMPNIIIVYILMQHQFSCVFL